MGAEAATASAAPLAWMRKPKSSAPNKNESDLREQDSKDLKLVIKYAGTTKSSRRPKRLRTSTTTSLRTN
jgi:hypothetical protein